MQLVTLAVCVVYDRVFREQKRMAKVIIGSQEESYWRLTRPPVRKLRSCSNHIICIQCKVFCELYIHVPVPCIQIFAKPLSLGTVLVDLH